MSAPAWTRSITQLRDGLLEALEYADPGRSDRALWAAAGPLAYASVLLGIAALEVATADAGWRMLLGASTPAERPLLAPASPGVLLLGVFFLLLLADLYRLGPLRGPWHARPSVALPLVRRVALCHLAFAAALGLLAMFGRDLRLEAEWPILCVVARGVGPSPCAWDDSWLAVATRVGLQLSLLLAAALCSWSVGPALVAAGALGLQLVTSAVAVSERAGEPETRTPEDEPSGRSI